ncbi:MAG: tRNA pseudouridine(38-40) synthase TruA [Pseudomonadales bacterium]
MMRIALGIEYDGSGFSGFQWQANARSVQATLEAALSQIAAEPIRVAAAGRTDAGVHATGQVISFSCHANRPLSAWLRGGNALLPADVKVVWASEVGDDFHARFSAVARRYQYLYDDSATASPLLRRCVLPTAALDDDAMHRAAQQLLGEHDFSTFRAAGCQSPTAHRCVHRVAVHRAQTLVVLDITANAFLLHMVRNIAGALLRVGLRQADEGWIGQILAGRHRELAGRTAPPDGLYLVDVHYPGAGLPAGRPAGLLRALGNLDRF